MANSNGGCNGRKSRRKKKKKEEASSDMAVPAPKKKKKKKLELSIRPDIPTSMINRITEMGGYRLHLAIQKQLQDTDLNTNKNRLSLPRNKVINDFVTDEEEKNLLLNKQGSKKKKGMTVLILDECLRESFICLKKWKMGNGPVYCLTNQWNSFAKKNSLKSGDIIQLWSFRKESFEASNGTFTSHLCFALNTVDTRMVY